MPYISRKKKNDETKKTTGSILQELIFTTNGLGGAKQKIGFALTMILVVVACIYALHSGGTTNENRDFSSAVLNVDRIEQGLYKMERANNGFLLTGNNTFRAPFGEQRDILSANYTELLAFTADDFSQQAQLKKFKSKLTRWFKLYNPMIIRRRSMQSTVLDQSGMSSVDRANLFKCKLLFDEMLSLLDEVRSAQESRLYSHQESE